MSSFDTPQLLRLYLKAAPAGFLQTVGLKYGYSFRDGVYTVGVVIWLMIWQRLQGNRSLGEAVQHLLQGGVRDLLSDCKRCVEKRVSAGTSSYCEARQRLPRLVVSEVTEALVDQLRADMREGWEGLSRPICVVDGSSLQLQNAPELVKEFPPGSNQHGENHWPVMRIVVFHDVFSGLAMQPNWGPMYGYRAVSEQSLAAEGLERLPVNAVVLGDGNFGIFAFAYAVQQSGRPMIFRLTQARAQKILGRQLREGTDERVVWQASRDDRKTHPELPDGACLSGRLIVSANPTRSGQMLYLFTTLDLPAKEILEVYKLRWNVETDLRSLKRTVGLHQLSSKNLDMAEKELLTAVAAYNLVRAVMCLAARSADLAPRQLSFSFVQAVVEAALPGLDQATTDDEYQERLERMLHYAAQGKLPNRSRRRSYPREVWSRGGRFPWRKGTVQEEAGNK
jgi:putative transposase